MFLFGLHPIDVLIVLFFLITILVIGFMASRNVKNRSDFFVGGRKMGGLLQFFLNFGQMADSNSAPTLASEIYHEGMGGIWIAFQLLLMTPFYWFSSIWFRRARQVTLADLFPDRFGSRRLAAAYALMTLIVSTLAMGMGNIVTYKVVAALVAKPEAAWTAPERNQVEDYKKYLDFRARSPGTLSLEEKSTYAILQSRDRRGELTSFISYIHPFPFYFTYTLVVGSFIMLGGIQAAALTDAVQGVLIIIFSIIMVPVGLNRIGGFHSLHHLVAASKFDLISPEGSGDYTWYSVGAIVLYGILGIAGITPGPVSASARDERSARIGALTGAFAKRLLTLPWAFCGLLALAVLGTGLADPDAAWGRLSYAILPPGLMGLMLAGMLLGHMPNVGVNAVNMSALLSRNLYQPLVPNRTERHYLWFAKIMVVVVLGLGILIPLFFSGVVSLMFTMWLFGAILGATFALLYFWRGLTASGVGISWVVWILLIGVVPSLVPEVPAFRQSSFLLVQTAPVAGNDYSFNPQPLFFDSIARIRPDDTLSASEGIGRFNVENYILYHLGMPLQKFSSAGLMTCRWLFDALVSFLLLMVFSLLTARKSAADQAREDRFFAKMKTPVSADPVAEAGELELSNQHPRRFDHLKLFPGTAWEFTKWSRHDIIGFTGCWLVVALILALLWAMVSIGA